MFSVWFMRQKHEDLQSSGRKKNLSVSALNVLSGQSRMLFTTTPSLQLLHASQQQSEGSINQLQRKLYNVVFVNTQEHGCRYELQRNNKSSSQPAGGNFRRPSLAAAAAGRQLLDQCQVTLGSPWTRTKSQVHIRKSPWSKVAQVRVVAGMRRIMKRKRGRKQNPAKMRKDVGGEFHSCSDECEEEKNIV